MWSDVIVLVADEAARSRRGIRRHVLDALAALGVVVEEVSSPTDIATSGLGADDQVLVVGDDPVASDVAASLVTMPIERRPSLGIVGSERNDFVRTFGLDRGPFVSIQHALSETVMEVDTLAVEVEGHARTAVNAVDIGWGATLLRDRGDRSVRLRHRIAAARGLDTTQQVQVTIDHTSFEEPLSRVIIANGQFLGPEGRVSPRALPDDGRCNVQSWGIFGDELIRGPNGLHVGEHLGHERIREHQTTSATIDAETPLPVAVDGVVVGTTPLSLEVAPRTLRLHV